MKEYVTWGVLNSQEEEYYPGEDECLEEEEINEIEWMKVLKQRRKSYGATQEDVARMAGIHAGTLGRYETEKAVPTVKTLKKLEETLELFNPDKELEIMFDYVRIRFPTTDARHIIEDILNIRMEYMLEEQYAFYGYSSQYVRGEIVVMTSEDEEKGTLLELKGQGCRFFEGVLEAQGRTWYDFFREAVQERAVWKRIDIAINDRAGILNIPELSEKCRRDECIGWFGTYKDYKSGSMIHRRGEDTDMMGATLYLGSFQSDVYFCIYEKDYEQFVKNGTPLEEAETKNRFEIRLKNERAEYAINDLLEGEDIAGTAFGIINHYVRFVDADEEEERRNWKMNERWSWFVDAEYRDIKLTTKPEPYTLERLKAWICRQVAPSLKVLKELDKKQGTHLLDGIIEEAKLSPQHKKILEQQMVPVEDIIIKKPGKEASWKQSLQKEYMG